MHIPSRVRAALVGLSREQRWFMVWIVVSMVGLAWLSMPGPRAGRAAVKLAQAHAAGQAAGTMDYVAHWVPKAAQAGLVVAGLLLLGTRWLVRPVPPAGLQPPPPAGRSRVMLVGFSGVVILYSAVANAPRLGFGLWGDEESTMRKSVVGQFERTKEGRLELDRVSWLETVFRYRDPNNHPLNSVLSRLSHTALAGDLTRPEGFYFDERAMRLPAFVASLLGLAGLAWFGWILGKPGLGAAAVLLMAAHPWFVRYGTETRGYAFLLCLTPLALGCLIRATQTGRWRWWIAYGLAQFLSLWSYPGALYLLVGLNMSALCLVLFLKGPSLAWRQAQAGRWLTACALGAVLCTLLMLPLVQPLMYYLKSPRMQGPMPAAWYPDALAWLATGLPWRPTEAGNPLCWSWQQWIAAYPIQGTVALGAAGLALLIGLWAWWRQGGICRGLLPAFLLQAPLLLFQGALTDTFLYTWYLFPALVGVVLVMAGPLLLPVRTVPVIVILGLAWFWPQTQRANQLLRSHPVEQMREGTKLTRAISLPSDPGIDEVMTIDILMTTRGYDPAVLPLPSDDPEMFKKYLAEADANHKPLYVHFGSPGLAASAKPQVMALIRNPVLFEEIAALPGMDVAYTRLVFRYRSGSLSAAP